MQRITKSKIVWRNVAGMLLYHIIALQGFYYMFTGKINWKTSVSVLAGGYLSGLGITCGAHRLWSHRAYKAKIPLRIFLAFLQTYALQNDIYEWSRDHRVHHKFTDTNADPHNSTRGFFFSHMGWLMVRKHPDVLEKGKSVDMSDLDKDPVIRFQKKYYTFLGPLCCFVLPTLVPWYFWNEDLYMSFATSGMTRYIMALHFTWLVNSAAHIWGTKPYDININPSENKWVSIVTQGEGWHNYHHVFPWDYRAAEVDKYSGNLSTGLINLMAKIGWAYELKSTPHDMIQKRIEKTGPKFEASQ